MRRYQAFLVLMLSIGLLISCGGSDAGSDVTPPDAADMGDVADEVETSIVPDIPEEEEITPEEIEVSVPEVEVIEPVDVVETVDLEAEVEIVDIQEEEASEVPPTGVGVPCETEDDCTTNAGCLLGFCTTYCRAAGALIEGACDNSDPDSPWGQVFACPADFDVCMPGDVEDKDILCLVDSDCAAAGLTGFGCAGALPYDVNQAAGRCLPVGNRKPVGGSCQNFDGSNCASLLCLHPGMDSDLAGMCTAYCDEGTACPNGTTCTIYPIDDTGEEPLYGAYCAPIKGSMKECESAIDCPMGEEYCGAVLGPDATEEMFMCMDSPNTQGAWLGDPCGKDGDCFGPYCVFGTWSDKLAAYCTQHCKTDDDCSPETTCRKVKVNPFGDIHPDSPYSMNICMKVAAGSPCFVNEANACEFEWSYCEPLPGGFPWLGECVAGECPADCEGKACRELDQCGDECLDACIADGGPCGAGEECLSGYCVEGVCCNAPCDGLCVSCLLPELTGVCTALMAGEDPEAECGVCMTCDGKGACGPTPEGDDPGNVCGLCQVCNGAGECAPAEAATDPQDECGSCKFCDGAGDCGAVPYGLDPKDNCEESEWTGCLTTGICNGEGQCEYWAAGTPCAEAYCEEGEYFPEASCDGFAVCVDPEAVECAPYLCDEEGLACQAWCEEGADCADGHWCVAGECQVLPPCPMEVKLICNANLPGTTMDLQNNWSEYETCVPIPYGGPERIYQVKMDTSTKIDVTISEAEFDVAIMLLEEACSPELACASYADLFAEGGTETLSFVAEAGVQYHLAVDGLVEGGGGSFVIGSECCQMQCAAENACGDDGCGGSCGECDELSICHSGQCQLCEEDPGVEPNDSCEEASPLEEGEYDDLLLCPDGDVDWYAIEMSEGEELSVMLEFDFELANLDLALYGPGCNFYLLDSVSVDAEEVVQYLAFETGTYYLMVYSPDWHQAGYSLAVSKLAPACVTHDQCAGAKVCGLYECILPPPPCQTAGTLGCSDLADGDSTDAGNNLQSYTKCTSTEYEGPESIYSLSVESEQVVTLSVFGQAFWAGLSVLDSYCASDWACIAHTDTGGPGVGVQVQFKAEPGTLYYVVVDGLTIDDFGSFSLNAECCAPACDGKECGPDGCGQDCGVCAGEQDLCLEGVCVCQPSCDGKECGDDGCGGFCGECDGEQYLCVEGLCECQASCEGKECGGDGCGGDCGECDILAQEICVEGVCECQPACEGPECGDDGCGGVCGECEGLQEICEEGFCLCVPTCVGKVCGDDGCGGSCGECDAEAQEECVDYQCECVPACDAKECGDDGCGGVCGECSSIELCENSICVCIDDNGFEPNNTCAAATPVTPATYPGLAVCVGGDADWYSIQVGAGKTLGVTALFKHEDGDLDLYVYKQGNCVGYETSSSSSTDNETISHYSATQSTYLVKIEGYSPSQFNSYVLEVTVD